MNLRAQFYQGLGVNAIDHDPETMMNHYKITFRYGDPGYAYGDDAYDACWHYLKPRGISWFAVVKVEPCGYPLEGSVWSYKKHPDRRYIVTGTANIAHRHPNHPPVVIYTTKGVPERLWTRDLRAFRAEFTPLT